jgi:alkanesulfonate monooxygenase SsuD/methylene tetrahydromethanopterin reductase-like flavin-dependent oxidoreductase (luciferase family)
LTRIGLELPPLDRDADPKVSSGALISVAEVARLAEDGGLGTLWLVEARSGGIDPMPVAGSLARVTSTLGIGIVIRPSLGRHPSVVARDVTTIDLLTEGRAAVAVLEDRAGSPDVERLGEATSMLHLLFTEEGVTVAGRFYEVAELTTRPRPARPRGPLVVAGLVGPAPGEDIAAEMVVVEASADAYVTGGTPSDVSACRVRLDGVAPVGRNPTLLWRGSLEGDRAAAGELASSILDAGADGMIVVLPADSVVGGAFERAAVVDLVDLVA